MNSYLMIKAAGEDAPVLPGEDNTVVAAGGTDVSSWLECSEFQVALQVGQRAGSPGVAGRHTWTPARFVLRLGKSTPWLFEAARTSKPIDLTLHLFHRHHETAEVEECFQYRIGGGRITSVRLIQPNRLAVDTPFVPDHVALEIVPRRSELESMTGSTAMVDDWANPV